GTSDTPCARRFDDIRVGQESVAREHRQHGVEVHRRALLRQLGEQDRGNLAAGEQLRGQQLDGADGRALADADEYAAFAYDQDVAALNRGVLVSLLLWGV